MGYQDEKKAMGGEEEYDPWEVPEFEIKEKLWSGKKLVIGLKILVKKFTICTYMYKESILQYFSTPRFHFHTGTNFL